MQSLYSSTPLTLGSSTRSTRTMSLNTMPLAGICQCLHTCTCTCSSGSSVQARARRSTRIGGLALRVSYWVLLGRSYIRLPGR